MTYSESDIAARFEALVDEAGWPDQLSPAHLGGIDQFHAGGLEVTDRLIGELHVTSDSRVLDAGSGFGGVARRIAETTGASVTGVDVTESYVEAARDLTARCGLQDLVTFSVGDLLELPASDHDAAVSLHVQMNLADKDGFFAALHRSLRPGGRLAIWDVCSSGDHELPWPMPWSLDGSHSHLVSSDELRGAAETAGFAVEIWSDETGWVNSWFGRVFENGPPAGPSLPGLLDDGFSRILNFATELDKGTLAIVLGVLTA